MLNKMNTCLRFIFLIGVFLSSFSVCANYFEDEKFELIHKSNPFLFKDELSTISLFHKAMTSDCEVSCGATVAIVETKSGSRYALSEFEYISGAPVLDQLITYDIDGDKKNELILKLRWGVKHLAEGTNAHLFKVVAYNDSLDVISGNLYRLPKLDEIDLGIQEGYDGLWLGKKVNYKFKSSKSLLLKIESNIEPLDYAKKINDRGEKYYRNKEYKKAILSFKEALEVLPDFLKVYSNLSLAYYRAGDFESSINSGYRVILGSTDRKLLASTYYNMAKSFESQKKWKEALQAYKDAKANNQHSAYDKGIARMKEKVQ